MLFIGNPRAADCTGECEEEVPNFDTSLTSRWDIAKLVICGVFLYVLTSLFSVILYYPVSLVSLIIPFVVLFYTVIALKGDNRRNLWFCVFAGFGGFVLKMSAIVAFFVMFPIGRDDRRGSTASLSRLTSIKDLSSADSKTIFFGVVALLDLLIALASCCVQWHLIAFNTCAPKPQRGRRMGHPV